jgi:hypothetical protein
VSAPTKHANIAGRILAAELWLLAMAVYHDGWTWAYTARAEQILMAYSNVFKGAGR